MKFSLTKVLLVIIVIILSISIGYVSKFIDVHCDGTSQFYGGNNKELKATKMNISTSFDDLIWFLQISDLHISIFRDSERVTDLEEFCKLTVDAIKPAVVLASGDLTDGRTEDSFGSRQFEEEWKLYRSTLDKVEIRKKTVWLDVRGNHDNFNVIGLAAKENYYRNYSEQGGHHPRSYLETVHSSSGKVYSFIALDACLDPGPKRPFNFFGLVNQEETERLQNLIHKASKLGSSHSVWFGHYPTSFILSVNEGVRSLIASDQGALAYLCGHLHTMGGMVPNMYTLQQKGFLELELGDWKENRVYRLVAIDHGLFSFVDIPHRKWPVILVTNPKHALFHIPGREPIQAMTTSTHIRILAFSTSNITSVKVQINNGEWQSCSHVKGPLYVKQWTPELYSQGIHHIKVEVSDEKGRLNTQEQPFSLDGSRLSYLIFPRMLLMANVSVIFQVLFGLSIVICVVPLSLMRLMLSRIKVGKKYVPTSSVALIRRWYRRLWILANINKFYYPLILYPVYVTFGPWTVGEIIENHVGMIFAWGTIIHNAYLPGSFTYAYGLFQMVTFQFPLTLILAYQLDKRLQVPHALSNSKVYLIVHCLCEDVLLMFIFILQLLFLYSFWLSYGTLAVILGPFRTWPLIATLYFWSLKRHIPLYIIQELAGIYQGVDLDSTRLKTTHST